MAQELAAIESSRIGIREGMREGGKKALKFQQTKTSGRTANLLGAAPKTALSTVGTSPFVSLQMRNRD